MQYRTSPGTRYPPGARVEPGGVNFSVFSRNASSMELLLYESDDSEEPFQVIRLDPETDRTFFFWHVFVHGLPPGTLYTWRTDGPGNTRLTGFRFSKQKELLDPWARGVSTARWDRAAACRADSGGVAIRGIVVGDQDYDWEGDEPLRHPPEQSIIYELHVGGFTRHPSSGVAHPGTFTGLIEKIPYLRELGITHVELMPVMAFDEQDVPPGASARGLKNFWGYSTHSFFAPHAGYATSPERERREFRDMVKALHRAGIGVILDVVLNHTAEGGADGPAINFKGFANEIFYHLDPRDRSRYRDFTGVGNTVNANHPLVAQFLLQCLEYWVREMHVDGFRFDLASVLARGEDGRPMYHAPVLWNIEFSNVLAYTRLIAEAWDAGGLYQVGDFPGFRWAEWNGRYRDVVRRFVRGDKGMTAEVAMRMTGSADLYEGAGRLPINSVNFVTCHDGFTLNDLVSYDDKHNQANGESNRDGSDHNMSWNHGVEGETSDPEINAIRRRQAKNFMAILLLSQGVPMILAGDEVLRTQRGNNNAYCQDNDIGWFDWLLCEHNADTLRFVKEMIAFRNRHAALTRRRFLTGSRPDGSRLPDVTWHGLDLDAPPWGDPEAQWLSYTLGGLTAEEEDIHIILNMSEDSLSIPLPTIEGRRWYRAIDTSLISPADIEDATGQNVHNAEAYLAQPRTVVVLESRAS